MKSNKEIWKDVPEWEGLYQVSDQGRVKSLSKLITMYGGRSYMSKERILKQTFDNRLYYQLTLFSKPRKKLFKVHQLVAMAFLDHKPNGHDIVVDHINNNKTDNRACNLQLISSRDNATKDQWRRDFTSKYVGVHWDKRNKKWKSEVKVGDIRIFLGRFTTEIEGHNAYQNALKNL